ncbi:MAG: triose-phosphate isomerase [Neomegalonema sp.]|nr:triose-phosphate isomerase [Neomegalonema sp.]
MARRAMVAGNWKMNGKRQAQGVIEQVVAGLADRGEKAAGVDCILCPPSTLLAGAAERAAGSPLTIGGQDAHAEPSGAHTGDISAEMLADAGAQCVILGHSERRADHGETDAYISAKVAAAWRAGLTAILCLGETEAQRDDGDAVETVLAQLDNSLPEGGTGANLAVAYEPIWAIGTGRTPLLHEISEIHSALRDALIARIGSEAGNVRLLYGGSVKPSNAAEIFAADNVDGALVGGASLKAEDFLAIIDAAAATHA